MSAFDGPGPLCLNGFNGSPYLGVAEDLPGWIEAAATAGFALFGPDRFALEAWLARGETLAGLARRMRDAGLGCGFIAGVAMLGTHDSSAELAWGRRAAETLGTRFLQVNVAAETAGGRLAAVERACTSLEGSGLRLAIEYLPFTPLDGVSETVAIVRHVGADRAGAMIDIWHHSRGPDGWDDLAAVPAEAIAYVELNDALPLASRDLAAETLSRRVFPGDGEFEVARFVETVRTTGYRGMASVEVLSDAWRGRPLADYAANARRSAAAFWG